MPPTEKRGRRQTSTITVAVLKEPTEKEVHINPGEIEETTYRGSGPGGQHRNKTDSAVRLKHIPTGIIVCSEAERSQHLNRETAWTRLRAIFGTIMARKARKATEMARKTQVGSGMRGDKRRTIRMQDDSVVDHVLNRKMKAKKYLRGHLEELYE